MRVKTQCSCSAMTRKCADHDKRSISPCASAAARSPGLRTIRGAKCRRVLNESSQKQQLTLALQPPHDLVELIEAAIAHMHHARFTTMIDRDLEPERIGDAALERHRVRVLVPA